MMDERVRRIADAVLFEGYMLYPYRASALKNRQRWNFGTLYPRDFARAQKPEEAWSCHCEAIFEGGAACAVDVSIRFLQLVPDSMATERGWEQGVIRNWTLRAIGLDEIRDGVFMELTGQALATESEPPDESLLEQSPLHARVEMKADAISGSAFRLCVTVSNLSAVADTRSATHNSVRSAAFASAHVLLHAQDGAFVSLLDPPEDLAIAAAECKQRGLFPVLVGEAGSRSDVLCSPIILYDYPRISAESAGDFFDGTEIDEMLALRVLTLSDEEKHEMRSGDPRARRILERTETLPEDHLLKLHGALRGMSASIPADAEMDGHIDPWNPFEEKAAPDSVKVFGVELRKGDRVRLRPNKRADILDMVMEGQVAIVEGIEQDLDDNVQLAVVLEDDPGKDLGLLRQPGHRFFFSPEEVEPLKLEAR